MAKQSHCILNESDYRSEVIGDMAIFFGWYDGYQFELTYSFTDRKWKDGTSQMPKQTENAIKAELYKYELWLPQPSDYDNS